MRATFSKALTASMIAGAALLVSACGGGETTTTTENTVITDLNATDATMDGIVSDNMTAVDGAVGNDVLMANDAGMASNVTTNAM